MFIMLLYIRMACLCMLLEKGGGHKLRCYITLRGELLASHRTKKEKRRRLLVPWWLAGCSVALASGHCSHYRGGYRRSSDLGQVL